jgi:hypothetical protein
MNISVPGERLGVAPDMDMEEDYMIDNPILRIEHNNIHPSGFIVSIEDGEEILNVRIDVRGMKRIIKHVIDDL